MGWAEGLRPTLRWPTLRWLPAALILLAAPAAVAAPQRVVSMNLCTDQLAMLLAAPGQLVAISRLTRDPRMSPLAERAKALPLHHSSAEEIHLLRPDLVIAGQFTPGPVLEMLRRLGHRVEARPPANSIADIRTEITAMGQLLGREAQAAALLADFDRQLAELRDGRDRGRAALYYANGFTSGRETLAGDILAAAGYRNIADDFGITGTAALPVEQLVLAGPELLVTGATWPGHSRSEAILDHPALAHAVPRHVEVADRDWVCGTPVVLRAIRALQAPDAAQLTPPRPGPPRSAR